MMTEWRYKIDLAGVMLKCAEEHDLSHAEEDCPAEVKEAIATEITKAWPLKRFAPVIRESKSIAEINRVLRNIYDEADRSSVWCGI
jgi:hypothetical protein